MKEFTKSDLKNGMFVQYRNGDFRVLLDGFLVGDGHAELSSFSNNLKFGILASSNSDILSVYIVKRRNTITGYLQGGGLEKIWERNEQTPAQKEMEKLQAQITKLQAQTTKLQAQAKALQSKL